MHGKVGASMTPIAWGFSPIEPVGPHRNRLHQMTWDTKNWMASTFQSIPGRIARVKGELLEQIDGDSSVPLWSLMHWTDPEGIA